MKEIKVLISVLNWNNWGSTVEAVKSILASEYSNYKLIILDNNSLDESVIRIKEYFPEIEVWGFEKNLGYAGAHKKAAEFALRNNFDLLWILNNDVKVYPFTLTKLVDAYRRNGKSLLGSVTVEEDEKTINDGGGAELIDNLIDQTIKYNQYLGRNYFETTMQERPVSDIGGASFVVPVSIIKQFGFLDTRFFLYCEEVDYCYKLREKYNIQSIVVPSAVVIHQESKSFSLSSKLPYIQAYYLSRNCRLLHYRYRKSYWVEKGGGILHYLKFFYRHYYIVPSIVKDADYWINYYKKLGGFHALIRLRGKYLEPNNFF